MHISDLYRKLESQWRKSGICHQIVDTMQGEIKFQTGARNITQSKQQKGNEVHAFYQ